MRLIDATPLVREILDVRDKIPRTVPPRPYENMFRGGIRKALHCIETAPTIDAVPIADVEAWLLEIAFNNTDSEYGNEAMASLAEDLANRMEGLRNFSKDRRKTNAG